MAGCVKTGTPWEPVVFVRPSAMTGVINANELAEFLKSRLI